MKISNLKNFQKLGSLGDFAQRVSGNGRAFWVDIAATPGLYIVSLELPLIFSPTPVSPLARMVNVDVLKEKLLRVNSRLQTDIIYIGKATDLRVRISRLIRFGAGRTDRHRGGEWMWQISQVEKACLYAAPCSAGKESRLENELLERFHAEHGDYPIANRRGG